jgi:dihydropteroate synthase
MIYFPVDRLGITKFEDRNFLISLPSSLTLDLKNYVSLMGVLNMSPDSFYIGYDSEKEALKAVEKMIEEGADVIDVGGQSTRPGAEEIPEEEEIKRIKIIEKIKKIFHNIPVSVDTYRSEVAKVAFDCGADILNDISGFRFDPKVLDVCKLYRAPAIAMHITAKPKVMQNYTLEDHVLLDSIINYLSECANLAKQKDVNVILDPGIGFGKKPHQNLIIINQLEKIAQIGYPVLIGVSRKSFIGFAMDPSNPPPPSERLEGTISACVISLCKGARILRVHDVLKVKNALKIAVSILMENFSHEKRISS